MKKIGTMVVLSLIFLASPSLVRAQPIGEPPMEGPPPGPLVFLENLFPPSVIMRYQAEIGLTDAQRETITKQMEEGQKAMVALQWDMERETQKFSKLLESAHVDEAAALQEADQVMSVENKFKKAHLALLIRIKNVLTPAQQDKLRQLHPVHPPAR
jgi:Spy/CpxP family protein refolding chaperone